MKVVQVNLADNSLRQSFAPNRLLVEVRRHAEVRAARLPSDRAIERPDFHSRVLDLRALRSVKSAEHTSAKMLMLLSTTAALAASNETAARPNFVLFLQDDQDERLGAWTPMKKAQALVADKGVRSTNWFIHTPVCCPSRAELLSGRYFHNVRMPTDSGGCMHVNESKVNPTSFGAALGGAGYTLGWFGKHMNSCPHNPPPGWDCPTCHWFANGGGSDSEPGGYLNASFSHFAGGVAVGPDAYHPKAGTYVGNTNGEFAGYTTSVIANRSIAWLRGVAAADAPWMLRRVQGAARAVDARAMVRGGHVHRRARGAAHARLQRVEGDAGGAPLAHRAAGADHAAGREPSSHRACAQTCLHVAVHASLFTGGRRDRRAVPQPVAHAAQCGRRGGGVSRGVV